MARKNRYDNYETHTFYCLRCGQRGIDLMRQRGHKHEDFHRKKLYCPHCKMEVNHIECKTQEDIEKFKEDFANGLFAEEVEESLAYLRDTRIG